MLDAVRHGHIEAVPWLVNEWRASSLVGDVKGPRRRHGHWRPERAQRILDGLATTEDLDCAEEVLRRAAPRRANSTPDVTSVGSVMIGILARISKRRWLKISLALYSGAYR